MDRAIVQLGRGAKVELSVTHVHISQFETVKRRAASTARDRDSPAGETFGKAAGATYRGLEEAQGEQ